MAPVSGCLDFETLEKLALGELGRALAPFIEEHLDGCTDCSRVVAELARIYGRSAGASTAGGRSHPATGPIPLQVGRYQLGARLGEGGMGVVFAAHDPELDRKVAIKLLHPDPSVQDAEQRARLLREAEVMARLSHPNVVAVHDVGRVGDQVFLAVELVEGTTLSGWLSEKPRTRQEILEVFAGAGRGLEVAHAAGIVHRDFKPDNVLIGRDGRPRVTDFGLARPSEAARRAEVEATRSRAPGKGDSRRLMPTRTGAILGTPAYMSPEQFRGARASALSDQFSFAVALYEALFGERPFAGSNLVALAASVARGRLRPIPRSAPAWLRRLLDRALSPRAADRFPSMTALLAELTRDRRRGLRLGLSLGAMSVGAVALAMMLRVFLQPPPGQLPATARAPVGSVPLLRVEPRCEQPGLDHHWNRSRRQTLEAAAARLPVASGARLAGTIARALEAYAARFAAVSKQLCQEPERLTRARPCLERHEQLFAALVGALGQGGSSSFHRAHRAIDELPAPESCPSPSPPGAALAPGVNGQRAALLLPELFSARQRLQLEESYGVSQEVRRLLREAQTLGHPPLLAEAQLLAGLLAERRNELGPAVKLLAEAAGTARTARHDPVVWEAALAMIETAGVRLLRPVDRWMRLAEQARPAGDPVAEATLALAGTRAQRAQQRYHDAAEALAALARQAASLPVPGRVRLHLARAETRLALGELEAASAEQRQAAALAGKVYADRDARQIGLEQLGAELLLRAGRLEEALAAEKRALELTDSAYGSLTDAAAIAHDRIARVLMRLERFDQARQRYERGRRARTQIDSDNPSQWRSELAIGNLLVRVRKPTEGVLWIGRALARLESHLGREDLLLISSLLSMARARAAGGEQPAARALAERALRIIERRQGYVSPMLAGPHRELARMAVARGDRQAALRPLDEAHLPLTVAYGSSHPEVDRNVLARADLRLALGEPARARELVGAVLSGVGRRLGRDHPEAARLRARLEAMR